MAVIYEIRDVGFIGSFWQGNFGSPSNIGNTLEVVNIESLTQLGGRRNIPGRIIENSGLPFISARLGPPGPSSTRASIYFTEIDKTNLQQTVDKLNSYLPENLYFKVEQLPNAILDEIANFTKIQKQFLVDSNTVLVRYDKTRPRDVNFSRFPVQTNWSFDTVNETAPKYISPNPFELHVNFTFIVPPGSIQMYKEYFRGLDSEQEDILTVGANPFNSPVFNRDVRGNLLDNTIRTVPLDPRTVLLGIREPAIDDRSTINNTLLVTDTVLLPPKPPAPKVYTFPAIDPESAAEERAAKLFAVNKSTHVVNSIAQFNEELVRVRDRKIGLSAKMRDKQRIDEDPNLPFDSTDEFQIRVQYRYYTFVENYLYEQIASQNNVSVPTVDPSRWEVLDNGDINILPPDTTVSASIVAQAIDDRKDLDEFDSFIDDMIDDLTIDDNNVYVFKKLSKVTDYSLPILRYKTKGLFRCTGEKLSTFHTSSLTSKQQKYYLSVRNEAEGTDESYHQFDVAYCHISGSGSSHIEDEIDLYPAKSMYKKYMLECFGHTNGKFPFKNGINGDYFYAIQLDRNQYKEKLDVGNFEIALCELSSSGTTTHPASTRFFTLIDESKDTKQGIVTNEGIQEYYYITSGSLRDGVYNEPEYNAWGVVFPKMGLIILDGVVLDQSCSLSTATGSADGQNAKRLFLSISGAAVPNAYRPSSSFFARSFETYLTETYMCRADFDEFNYSTNYTYTTGSNGFLKYDYFSKEPRSFISTIGLYNKQKELLAVGKLRNPIQKNDGKVCIFEVVVRLN